MKRNDATREFDCVEFKNRAQAEIYEEIKSLSPEEEIDYFRQRSESGSLGRWWKSIQKAATRRAARSASARRDKNSR